MLGWKKLFYTGQPYGRLGQSRSEAFVHIDDFPHVYAVVHDLQNERSVSFSQIELSRCSLKNNTNGKIVSPYLYGVFSDDRNNIFLAMRENINTYTFDLVLDSTTHSINNVIYEHVSDILTRPASSSVGFFKFMDSQPAARYSKERCDALRNGPAVFIRPDQIPIGIAVNSLRPMLLSDLEVYFSLLSVDGVGHLIYVKYFEGQNDSNEEFETNESDLPTAARSLFPALKVIVEWAEMTKEPWNSNEPVAVAANEFLNKIGMPNDVRNDIEKNQTDMSVYRYLRGDHNARRQPNLAKLDKITPLTLKWVKSKMFYKNVSHFYRSVFLQHE